MYPGFPTSSLPSSCNDGGSWLEKLQSGRRDIRRPDCEFWSLQLGPTSPPSTSDLFFNYYVMFLSMRSFNNAELEMICIGSFHTVSATQLNNHLRIFWKSFGEHNWYLLYSPCWPWRGRSGCPRASWSRLDLFKSICLWKMAYKHVSCQFLMNITGTCCTRLTWACRDRWGCPRAPWSPLDQFELIYRIYTLYMCHLNFWLT